jgi:hypothetical protein
MKNKYLTLGATACLVIAIGVGGVFAEHLRTSRQIAVGMCESNKDFYADHSRWCDSAEKRHLVTIHHRVRQEFPPVQTYEPSITVTRDRQAADDGGHAPDRFIALQTAEDVARSPTVVYGLDGWFASAFDLGRKHPPIMTAEAPRPIRTAAIPAQRPTRVTTNGGPVYITNSRVTVAQQ